MNAFALLRRDRSTVRLAATYLAIIMVLCIGFSITLYTVSSQQLGRQIPPDSFYGQQGANNQAMRQGQVPPTINDFLQNRAAEGRRVVRNRLLLLNIAALCIGSVISYLLARAALRPIEAVMEAQTQFVSDASHELRTPLTAIQASNEVFLRRAHPTLGAAQEVIRQNTADVIRLQALTDGLLELARSDSNAIKLSAVSLHDVVSEALTQVAPQALAKHIAIEDASANLTLTGDKTLITRLLIVLLDNAVKYSDADKTITISTRTRGSYGYIAIKDQGIGFRESDIPHLFRRFYRADNARTRGERSGYGLGLAMAKQIVELHHGSIQVVSQLDSGSTFTCKLPLMLS